MESDAERAAKERGLMEQPAYVLDSSDGRNCVLEALLAECLHRGWVMLAAHVRSTHVHVNVTKFVSDFTIRITDQGEGFETRRFRLP